MLTAHSQALSDLDPKVEPPDGSFLHRATGRTYRVYRQGGEFRHAEVLTTPEGQEIGRIDLPIRYLIGSGRFSRSYLLEADGFLHESPITWYTSRQQWDMSPGYDFPQHASFERQVKPACLACHSGRAEAIEDSVHRIRFLEKAIGCESCHGPGSLHVDLHRQGRMVDEDDWTIVNPAKLPRRLQESICAACHLNAAAAVYLRGRRVGDYRPGRPLADYRIDYQFDAGKDRMTVVGHVEQLRLSRCYQESDLTCRTCHDPHAKEKPADLAAFYRQTCLGCHEPPGGRGCRAEITLRRGKNDDCTICHMPRGDTDIPHIAFTHHRIGRHGGGITSSNPDGIPGLVAIEDDSILPELDRKRNLGLAYHDVGTNPQHRRYAVPYVERARELLETTWRAGLRDGPSAQALTEIWWKRDPARAAEYGVKALQTSDLPADGRGVVLIILVDGHLQSRDFAAAMELLEKLVRLRRYSEDWRLLGLCRLELGDTAGGIRALEQALAIRPFRPDIQDLLAQAYRLAGDSRRALDHERKSHWLFQNRQE